MKKQIIIKDQNKALTDSDVLKFEEKIGVSLPIEYREFILLNNGGEPTPDVFPLIEHPLSAKDILNRFLCIEEEDMYDILYMKDLLKDRLPNDLLPIAVDPGGNLICLGTRGERYSKIYFCLLDEGDSGEITIYYLANTFTEFLESLHD